MNKKQERLLFKTCTSPKYNKLYSVPVQLHGEIVSSDIHRLTIISDEEHGQFLWNDEFPAQYRNPCPKIQNGGIKINGKLLAKKLKAAMGYWPDGYKPRVIPFRMMPTDGGIMFETIKEVSLRSAVGSFLRTRFFMPCDMAGKADIPTSSINGKYLLDAASCLDEFEMSQKEGLRPLQIKAGNLEHYIMPLRI